jgi:hypothetical protein
MITISLTTKQLEALDNTLPWDDEGWRILPSANHMEFMEKIRNMRDITQREYNAFVDNFPETMRKARIALNGTFCESDYPTLDALRAMFAFKIGCQQLPDSMSDFRIQLPKSEIEEIKRDWDNRISQAVENAQRDLYQRLAEPLSHLSAKLHDERGIFRDSIITNVLDICNIIPALNITKDRKLEDLRQVVMANLSGVRPDDLRHDMITRKKTAKKVDDICATLSDYFPQAKAA